MNVAHMEDRKVVYSGLVGRDLWERVHLEYLAVDRRVIMRWAGVDWVDVAQDRDRWRSLVNVVMNFRFP